MKDFILYLQPRGREILYSKESYLLQELIETAGTSHIAELEIVKSGKLRVVDEIGDYRMLMFTCDYIARHGPSLSLVENRDIELWQSKKGALVASFGFPRKVARVAAKLLSLAAFTDPSLVDSFSVMKSDFLGLRNRV